MVDDEHETSVFSVGHVGHSVGMVGHSVVGHVVTESVVTGQIGQLLLLLRVPSGQTNRIIFFQSFMLYN